MSVAATDASTYLDLCVCAECLSPLADEAGSLVCTVCATRFHFHHGVLHLLSEYEQDPTRRRYVGNYEQIARADLATPFEHDRDARHEVLAGFVGDVSGKRVLDVGSSNAGYLRTMDARLKVAIDVAAPFLEAIPEESGIIRVCADAETLPFAVGAFDVIIVSDVLEHLLEPERFVQRVLQIASPDTRIIVHVPWRENIDKYKSSEYEFTHLRSFSSYTFELLWNGFAIVRERSTHPSLEDPYVFALRRFLPRRLYNLAVWHYFHGGYAAKEYERRASWIAELPKRERWLLHIYNPLFKMFELRMHEARPQELGGGFVIPLPAPLSSIRRASWRRRTSRSR